MSKISELSDGGSLVGTDYLIAVRSGGNVKVKMDQINVDQVDLGDNEFIRLGNSQDLTLVHTSTQSIINQAGIGDLLIQKAGTTKASITANGLEFPDNSKAIFGAGSDLQIYHDGSHSYVSDQGTGNVRILAENFQVRNPANTEAMILAIPDFGVSLYYNDNAKFATTATGIDVTGYTNNDSVTTSAYAFKSESNSTSASTHSWLRNPNGFIGGFGTNGSDLTFVHSGSANEKLRINSTGIDVTGTVTADGLTVDGTVDINNNIVTQTALTPSYNFIESDVTDENTQFIQAAGTFRIRTVDDAGSNAVERMRIDHGTGDISFYNAAGNSQSLFWDASAESLGIGTSSVRSGYTLDVQGANDNGVNIQTGDAASDIALSVGSTSTADKFVVLAGGSVGIGTDSPSALLHLKATGGSVIQQFETTGGTVARTWKNFVSSGTGAYHIQDATASANRVVIDTSGNLLVGTADDVVWDNNANSAADNGSNLRADGRGGFSSYQVTANSNATVNINRTGSDGDAIRIFKSGTLVGGIGTSIGSTYIGGNGDGALYFNGSSDFRPWNKSTQANADGVTDLGANNARFKYLYLSGGVFLGGTVAANKLDDYEEGAWIPTINNGTFTVSGADYTKVGNLVTLRANLQDLSDNTDVATISIGGLPFLPRAQYGLGSCMFRYFSKTNAAQMNAYIGSGATALTFYWSLDSGASWVPVQFRDGTQTNMDIIFTISYTTDL